MLALENNDEGVRGIMTVNDQHTEYDHHPFRMDPDHHPFNHSKCAAYTLGARPGRAREILGGEPFDAIDIIYKTLYKESNACFRL